MILCEFKGVIHLASNYIGGPDCSICVPLKCPGAEGYTYNADQMGNWLKRPDMSGITFYPELFWHVLPIRLRPIHWTKETSEPMLYCSAMVQKYCGITSATQLQDPQYLEAIDAVTEYGFKVEYDDMSGRVEGFYGYVNVDDIIKIEGPPPEGSF